MEVASTIEIEWVEDEAVALDTASGEFHYLNTSAALALALIQEHGFDQALLELKARRDGEEGSEDELTTLIDEMVEKGLLVR